MGISADDEGVAVTRPHDDAVDAALYALSAAPKKLSLRSRIPGYLGLAGFFLGLSPWLYLYTRALYIGFHDPDSSLIALAFIATVLGALAYGVGEMFLRDRIGITVTKIFLTLNTIFMIFGLGVSIASGSDILDFMLPVFIYAFVNSPLSWLYLKYSGTVKRIYGV